MKTLIFLRFLTLVWLKHENRALHKSFAKVNTVATDQKRTIGMLKDQLLTSQRPGADNDRAKVALRDKLTAAGRRAARREHMITRLLNENEELRRWHDTKFPAAVRSLYIRAHSAYAGRCVECLPEGESLPDAGQ
ncbi:LysB family phage lysis regulatory protein [Enterobacter cloacae]